MAISRLTLAAIMVLGLGLSTLSGPAMAAPVNPIVALNDFYRDSKPTGYLLGGSAGGQWLKPDAAAGLIAGRRKLSPLHPGRRGRQQPGQQAGQRRRRLCRHVST